MCQSIGHVFIVRGTYNLTSALLIFAHFLGKTSRFLGLLLNCRYGPMMLQHGRTFTPAHFHKHPPSCNTVCNYAFFYHLFTKVSIFLLYTYFFFTACVGGDLVAVRKKIQTSIDFDFEVQSTSGLVYNGNRFNWF